MSFPSKLRQCFSFMSVSSVVMASPLGYLDGNGRLWNKRKDILGLHIC